ncbi:MAG: hypothetical protein WBP26_05970 [Candidatus Saccharimonadales bacterium]
MEQEIAEFQEVVWRYYAVSGRRDLLWRIPEPDGSFDSYKILVSEIMLQQTQVGRVIPKFQAFLDQFPSVQSVAESELSEMLRAWQGLGYNRRAKYLWQACTAIWQDYHNEFPQDITELVKLPGIGKNTAGAILAYAYNQPVAFIETNIRTVYIHHFFEGQHAVPDTSLIAIIEQSLPADVSRTREWYWALMDYGTHLKQSVGNLSKLSKSYVKQSTFHGSKRQLRGAVLRELSSGSITLNKLRTALPDERLDVVLADLQREGLIHHQGDDISL